MFGKLFNIFRKKPAEVVPEEIVAEQVIVPPTTIDELIAARAARKAAREQS